MVDGVNRSSGGYGGYGVGGFGNKGNGDVAQGGNPTESTVINNYEETQVDPSKVMDFLARNNFFIAPSDKVQGAEVDPATEERIAGYMEKFEMIYGIVLEEFGEELAPAVMDVVMDTLMNM